MPQFRTIGSVSVSGKVFGWVLNTIKFLAGSVIRAVPSMACVPSLWISGRDPAAFKMALFAGD